jgi:hypothetical protein
MKKHYSKILQKNKKIILLSSISTLIVVTLIALPFLAPNIRNNLRKNQIISIIDNLKLEDNKYIFKSEFGFDDKTALNWALPKHSKYTRSLVRNTDGKTTIAELTTIAKNANLHYINNTNPNEDSAVSVINYKTAKNEYVRFYISSKLREDMLYNKPSMTVAQFAESDAMINSAPTNVMVVINLDGAI